MVRQRSWFHYALASSVVTGRIFISVRFREYEYPLKEYQVMPWCNFPEALLYAPFRLEAWHALYHHGPVLDNAQLPLDNPSLSWSLVVNFWLLCAVNESPLSEKKYRKNTNIIKSQPQLLILTNNIKAIFAYKSTQAFNQNEYNRPKRYVIMTT